MKLFIGPNAQEYFRKLHSELKTHFLNHFRKIKSIPPRRHLRLGLPFFVEKVTKQARAVYAIKDDEHIEFVRCFAKHKDYENWLKRFD